MTFKIWNDFKTLGSFVASWFQTKIGRYKIPDFQFGPNTKKLNSLFLLCQLLQTTNQGKNLGKMCVFQHLMPVFIEFVCSVVLSCIALWLYDMGLIVKTLFWVDLHFAVLFLTWNKCSIRLSIKCTVVDNWLFSLILTWWQLPSFLFLSTGANKWIALPKAFWGHPQVLNPNLSFLAIKILEVSLFVKMW